jgi:peptidoglycan hydrolase-like protein with peptidoglycan-binding domain
MRRWLLAGGVVTLGAAAAVGVAVSARDGDPQAPAATPSAANANVATVTRRDLARSEELDGTVGFGEESPLVLPLGGTLTSLPAPGDVIEEGTVVATVDGRPVVALIGSTPLWRDLGPGVDDGADVLAVEQALQRLGFTAEFDVTVDGDWTDATTRAVKAFQEHFDQDDDGEITRGEIVMVEAPQRIASVGGVPGQASSEAAIEVSGRDQVVSVALDVADASLVAVGDEVTVELPDGGETGGKVTAVGRVAESPPSSDDPDATGDPTIEVEVTLDDPKAAGSLDQAPVRVSIVTGTAEDVLTVPVNALVSVIEGGYAVEVDEGGRRRLVAVEKGMFADGRVEVTGDGLAEGAKVVVPA